MAKIKDPCMVGRLSFLLFLNLSISISSGIVSNSVVIATTLDDEGGDEEGGGQEENDDASDNKGTEDEGSPAAGDEENNDDRSDDGSANDDDDTDSNNNDEEPPPAQDDTSAMCSTVEPRVPTYTDDKGCPAPCPPPLTNDNRADSIPEQCPRSQSRPATVEEQTDAVQQPQQQQLRGSYWRNTNSIQRTV